jgi:hypothetical protein
VDVDRAAIWAVVNAPNKLEGEPTFVVVMLKAVVVDKETTAPALFTLVTINSLGKYAVELFTGIGVKATAFKFTPLATPIKRKAWLVETLLGCADTVVAGPGLLILCFL